MAGKTVTVGCKLPHGIIIEHPAAPDNKVLLKGLNRVAIIGADYATTEVDGEFWEAWKAKNADFAPLKSGAIFEAKSAADAVAVARELADEKTGFEPMPQNAGEISPATSE